MTTPTMTPPLGTPAEEAALCRAAFVGVKVGARVWHCHHMKVVEKLTERAGNRIDYILTYKPDAEQALRLRLFRPVRHDAAVAPARKAYDAAVAPARKAYDAAVAPAQAAYDAAVAAARKAYDAAVAPAQAAYDAAVASAHERECPGCPWDGSTIFSTPA